MLNRRTLHARLVPIGTL